MKKTVFLALFLTLLLCLFPSFVFADEGETYTLVTDASQLAAGDEIILVSDNGSSYVAMTSGFGNVQVTRSGNSIAVPYGILSLTLVEAEGGWLLSTGSAYLTASDSSLTTVTDEEIASVWTISIANEEATISTSDCAIYFSDTNFYNGSDGNPVAIYFIPCVDPNETFTITWLNYDGTVLGISEAKRGEMPVYTGEIPVKPSDPNYSYQFIGWSPDLVYAIEDTIYTAHYQARKKCGNDLCWFFDDDSGVLTVTGNGRMDNFSVKASGSLPPWYSLKLSITGVLLSDGVISIGEYAFTGCEALTSITIPDSVTSIGYMAFNYCTELTSITIPDSVTYISSAAFYNCPRLTSITLPNSNADFDMSAFLNTGFLNAQNEGPVYLDNVLLGFKGTCSQQILRIESGTRLIANNALRYCSSIQRIIVPDSVTRIGIYAFERCTELTSITISNNITSIGTHAFSNCTGLTDVYYQGTERTKEAIQIGSSNDSLLNAIWHYLPVSNIEWVQQPDVLTYDEGQDLNVVGGKIKAYYDYNIEEIEDLTVDMVSGFDNMTVGTQTLTVTFGEMILTYDVIVNHHVPGEPMQENVVESTCIEEGSYDEVVYCSVCGAELSRETKTIDSLGHTLVHHDAQAPTCTEIGWEDYDTCSRCDYTTYVEFPALDHDLVQHEAKAATCTEIGWEAYDTCSRCDYTTYVEIPALGHDLVHHDVKATTCTEIGWDAYDTCSRCDYTTYAEIPALGHDLVHHDAKAVTCTEIGWEAYDICSRCNYTTYAEIPALGHDLVHHDAKAATCTEIGWDAYDTCSRCNYTTYVEIPALDHVEVIDAAVAPTCTETGLTEGKHCSRCNTVLVAQEEVAMLGHDLAHHETQAATCTEVGWEAYDACSRCDYTTKVETPALGHDLVHHEAQAATCTGIGWDAYDTCSRCNYTTYVEIPALDHVEVIDAAVAPTCTETGLTEGKHCSRCNTVLVAQEEVAVLGHDLVHHETQAATCTEVGWEAYDACSRCDYMTKVEIPALGHDLVHHEAQASTCTGIGWDAYDTCSRCNYTTYAEIPALGHDLVRHDAKAATCTEIGWDDYDTCSRCDYTTYVELPALGHILVHHDAQTATCTAIGWDAYDTCSRCDYTTYTEIPALGHDLVHHEAQASTCTGIGWDAYDTCSRCDYTTYAEIPALSHTPGEAVRENVIPASIETEGSYDEVIYCTICNQELSREKKIIEKLTTSGVFGYDLIWSFDSSTGVLTITGSGEMESFVGLSSPWNSVQDLITSVSLPEGLTSIGDVSFFGCTELTDITIPDSLTSIGVNAFLGCDKLMTVTYAGTEAQRAWIRVDSGNDSLLNATWRCKETTPSASPTFEPTAIPTPTPTPTPTPEPATVKKVQAKKSLKLTAPKIKKAAYQWMYRTGKVGPWQSMGKKGSKQKLSVKATMALDGYQYRCRVTSPTGSVSYTDIYELYVYEPLKVKKQPKWGKASMPGSRMTLSITATGASSYQWYTRPNSGSAWRLIEGATGTSYVVDVQEGMGGTQFACQISGKQGTVMSKAATVKMAKIPAPKIKKQPVLKKPVVPGTIVTLKVTAINAETYQWYYRTSAKGAWIIMGGETKPTLTFTAAANGNGYQYKCTVKGRGGAVDSKPVTLKVIAP